MAQAVIIINGTPASEDDAPIAIIVTLDNQNNGGEVSFFWEIIDQPPGPPDFLSSSVLQNPTFTPLKEGTYLIQLTVNGDLVDRKIVGVRQILTNLRIPAAQETVQDGTRGWATTAGQLLQLLDQKAADPGVFIAAVDALAPAVSVGEVVRATSTETLKFGLPGQQDISGWAGTNATIIQNVDQELGVVTGAVDGGFGPFPAGTLILIRLIGMYQNLVGVPVAGDPVYVNDAGFLDFVPGTIPRKMGNITRVSGGTYDVWIDGLSPSDGVALAGPAPVLVSKAPAFVGVGLTAARDDHKHDVFTAAAGAIAVGDVAAEGVATSLARSDHKHGLAAPAAPVDVTKAAAAAGVALTVARADHKHDVSTAVPVSIDVGDAAAEGVATSLARSDHQHALAAPAAPVDVTKAAASAGVALTVARADHKHDISTATAVSVGTANTEGVATSLSRSDHVHKGTFLQSVFAQITVDTTTASVAFVTLLSQAITIQAGSVLLIHVSAGTSNSANTNTNFFRIQVDGATQRGVAVSLDAANTPGSVALVLRVTGLAAGSRTVVLQWRVGAGTGRIGAVAAPDAEHASLLLEEVTV